MQSTSEDRLGKIGGSDIPAILGQDRYRSPYRAWRQIMGLDVTQPNEHMLRGQACEPAIMRMLAPRFGDIHVVGRLTHPEHDWLIASPDGVAIVDGRSVVIEAKAPVHYDGSPRESYVTQVQHYAEMLRLHGFNVADYSVVAILCGALHTHQIERDADRWEQDLWLVTDWHKRHVLANVPPPLSSDDDVAIAHPTSTAAKRHVGDQDDLTVFQQLHYLRAKRDQAEADVKAIETSIKVAMGDAEEFWVGDDRLATWKSGPVDRLDTTRLKAEQPELAATYTKRAIVRQFRLKGTVTP